MISILMPVYNGIEYIYESVNSVINQTYIDWELIIGINGHIPNSKIYKKTKSLEKYDNRIKVYDLNTIGKSNSLNEMLKYSKYNYIAILDVDDIWENNKLEIQSKYLKYDVIGSKCIYFGEINGIIPELPIGEISNFDFYKFNPIINSSSIIKKELCYWEDIYNLEDYNLWLKLWKLKKQFYNVDKILVKHRIHKESYFNNKNNKYVKELINYHKI